MASLPCLVDVSGPGPVAKPVRCKAELMESLCLMGWLSASDRYSVGSFQCRLLRFAVGGWSYGDTKV